MNMMRRVLVAIAVLLGASLQVRANDVVYHEKPDTEPIVVKSGDTASILGQAPFKDWLYAAWTFDNPDDLLHDDSGHGVVMKAGAVSADDDEAAEALTEEGDVIRGAASAGIAKNKRFLKLESVPEVLKGEHPYTISFWVRVTDQIHLSNDKPVGIAFYMGNSARSHDDNNTTNCVAIQFYNMKSAYVGNLKSNAGRSGLVFDEDITNRWYYAAIVYTPPANVADLTATGTYEFYFGDKSVSATYRLMKDPVDVCRFGAGINGSSARYLRNTDGTMETAFDEIFIFTNALSAAEVAYVREHSRPADDFSAEWAVAAGGVLDLLGTTNQIVKGYGTVKTARGLVLSPTNDAYFGGAVAGNGLAVAADAVVTQTLSGVSSYDGRTVVKGGTLLIQPQTKVPDALKNGLIGYWTFDDPDDPGYDLSGFGNHLSPTSADAFDAPVASEAPGGGRMMRYDFAGQKTDSRMVWRTSMTVNGLDKTQTDYGCSVSVAVWARLSPDWGEENYRTGVAGFSGDPGTGIGFNTKNLKSSREITFGNRSCNNAGSYKPSEALDDALHLYVLTYDVGLIGTAASDKVASFYFDGKFISGTASYKSGKLACNGCFEVGGSIYSTSSSFAGVIDQAMLFNRALSEEEVVQLQAFGQHPAPTDATGVLPATTVLEVRSGATAAFENANETVAGLAGAGAVDLTARSRLAVTGTMGFTGTVTGEGKLALGANLKWETPVDEKGAALAGTHTFFTVPAAMLEKYSTAGWTLAAPLRARGTTFKFVAHDNGDDTVTFKVTVTNPGLVILFR